MRSRVLAVAVLATAAVVAGCSEIPTSGPVIDAGAVGPQPDEQGRYIEVIEAPPRPGMTPKEIVDGFIEAMASYQPGYETAQEYLTDEAAASWDPYARVAVHYEAKPVTNQLSDNVVHVETTPRGEIGSDGAFREDVPPSSPPDFDLRLEQVNGEWRIANPPPGILISDFSLEREYQARNVYFFDPGFEVLVPDVVYLPRTANDATATLLARKVLSGPTDWLAPAVATAFRPEAELGLNGVPVRDGVATVELSSDAALAGPEEQERMVAQLAWTLGVLPEVEKVRVLANNVPLLQGDPLSPHDPPLSAYDPSVLQSGTPLYAIGETGVVSVSDGELIPVPGPLGEQADAREVAVNLAGNRGVVISGDHTTVRVASFGEDEPLDVLFTGVDLTSPAWDRTGLVWAVDHGVDGPGIVVTRPDGQPVAVTAPDLAGRDVERLAVSPDGTRLALVIGGEAMVANVIRDADSDASIRIDQPRPIGPAGVARDVAWSSTSPSWSAADTVVVLLETESNTGDTTVEPYNAALSGQETLPRGGLPAGDAVQVGAAAGLPVVLESGDGVLYVQRSSNAWSEIGPARSPAYPG
ncbi:LpqB family beta-propeller domain-containing protein [Jiangella endophytica]|uniref:LpqB family beta-propeller domain-containing protein n=1 Tax=Jiangella endophytica TaxID=1623398 RepID=UPI000E344584|nr:LpqB family beta-propeller domain-containing protein [Jiangella endophytica]